MIKEDSACRGGGGQNVYESVYEEHLPALSVRKPFQVNTSLHVWHDWLLRAAWQGGAGDMGN